VSEGSPSLLEVRHTHTHVHRIKTMTSSILDYVAMDYLYLGTSMRERYVLGIVQEQDYDSLGIIIG
jgi:hypothetical protein